MIKLVLFAVTVVAISSTNGGVTREKRAALKEDHWLWPGGVVVYEFSSNLDNAGKNRLRDAMRHIEQRTCIKFRQRRHREPNYVYMQYDFSGDGKCQANVGYQGGRQDIWIANPEVLRKTGYCALGDVIHELGHCLGFFHEQARPDRDNFVKIHLKNLAKQYQWAAGNFDKVDKRYIDYRGARYDYGSLMHYPKDAFAAYGKVTIEPINRYAHIGQKDGLSAGDIAQLKKMYYCK